MKFLNYLTEDETAKKAMVDMIKRDCRPFLETIRPIIGTGKCFVRRIRGSVPFIVKKAARTDRKPLDTDIETHMAFDAAFKDKFGWKARSEGVFTFPAEHYLNAYHGQNIFYPIGEFKFIYSPKVSDLYVALLDDDPEENVKEFLSSYTNKNLLRAFKSKKDKNLHCEVMFKCAHYYVVNNEYGNFLRDNGIL